MLNKLLERQLRRNKVDFEELSEKLKRLLSDISHTYEHHDADRDLIERSIDLSSQELFEANKKLRAEAENRKIVLRNLKSMVLSIRDENQELLSTFNIEDEDLISISDFLTNQIQKRKEAEKKLKLYERAINSSSNGIIITDPNLPDNPMIFCNPSFLQITGYSEEEVLGRNCRFLQGKEKDQESLSILRNAIKEKRSCAVTLKNYKKDGSLFWNELKISPIFDTKGNVTNYIGIQSDVSPSIISKALLQESTTRLAKLIETIAAGILVEDERRKIVIVNNEFCRMFNIPVSPNSLVGTDCSQSAQESKHLFRHPEEFVSRIENILYEKKIVINEELHLSDGCIFERDYVPIFVNENYKGHLWNYRDITARKNNELELLRIKNQLELVLNTVGEGIITIDKTGQIILINDEVEKICGWKREELIAKNIQLLMPARFREQHTLGMQRYLLTRESNVLGKLLRLEGLKKDNTEFPMQMRIKETIIEDDIFFTAAISDITELNKLIKDLQISNKALSEFAYIASHDLREPLRKISTFGSLLSKSLSDKLSIDDRENLDFMIDGATRMQRMIDDLLLYSRITIRTKDYSLIDLDELINEIIYFDLSEMINDTNAKVLIENALGKIYGERTQIKQLFQNLIGNGIKYRKLSVDPVVKVRSQKESLGVEFQIEDNGIGIDEKYRDQIFEMFKRLHSKEKYEGSGIGLSICKKIVEVYGGEIFVDSELDKGSIFTIRLPLKDY